MNQYTAVQSRGESSILATNRVIRNTYLFLGLTLAFSALMAGVSMAQNALPMNPFFQLIVMMGLLFAVQATQNSVMGIVLTFAFTGFMGYTLGPLLNYFLTSVPKGQEIIFSSLGGTAMIFFAASGYAMTTRQNFNYLFAFLSIGITVAFVMSLLNVFFFQMPVLSLGISCLVLLVNTGFILFETSQIIQGGQRNYVLATLSIYLSLYNIFISLLQILSFFSNNRD
jgi:modulator of FtsH protease